MDELMKEAAEMLTALRYCRNHELCEGCPMEKRCLDRDNDFTITQGAAEIIEKLLNVLEKAREN